MTNSFNMSNWRRKYALMNEADIEVQADKIRDEEKLSLASNSLVDFESMLKNHDFYYMNSDDSRAYAKGASELVNLKKKAKELADMGYGDDAAKLYDEYNPFQGITFDRFIAPVEPFMPMYKKKQMGLAEETNESIEEENPVDIISMDVPLFLRMLEYAREDASQDMDLHNVAEKAVSLSSQGQPLSMMHYDEITAKEAPAVTTMSLYEKYFKG